MELIDEDTLINEIRINLVSTFHISRDRADELIEEYYDIIVSHLQSDVSHILKILLFNEGRVKDALDI